MSFPAVEGAHPPYSLFLILLFQFSKSVSSFHFFILRHLDMWMPRNIMQGNDSFKCQKYIKLIKNPSVREVFTKLRINFNTLEYSKHLIGNSENLGVCQKCSKNLIEDPKHLLFECDNYSELRQIFIEKMTSLDRDFDRLPINVLLLYVLDLRCPAECINAICSFVHKVYEKRNATM